MRPSDSRDTATSKVSVHSAERGVVEELLNGKSVRDAAKALGVGPATVLRRLEKAVEENVPGAQLAAARVKERRPGADHRAVDRQALVRDLLADQGLVKALVEALSAAADKESVPPAAACDTPPSPSKSPVKPHEADYAPLDRPGDKKVRARVGAPVSSKPIKVLAIGDSHDHPGIPDKSRARLIGLHAAAIMPDFIVHLGDASDANSACHHVRDNTFRARFKPSFEQDLDSFSAFWVELNAPIAGLKIRKHITLGNHERWWYDYEDEHPACQGMVTSRLEGILKEHGWTFTQFGEFYYLGGVGFVHAPLNIMGKPISDERTIARRWSIHDTVFGHTHKWADQKDFKIGPQNSVRVINVGSSMPEGYVGDYAKYCPNAYDYGVAELVIFDGRIQGVRQVTMRELEHLYGGHGTSRRAA